MIVLMFFAFLAGIVTILSPCILPVLPIILSGSISGGKWRPLGVVLGFVSSFTFFAVFAFGLSQLLGFSTEFLRTLSVLLLFLFGLSLFFEKVQFYIESIVSRWMPSSGARYEGFWGGIVLGLSLGFIWTPCVGPILASVLTLAATQQVSYQLVAIAASYSLGSALPMLAISYGGKRILHVLPLFRSKSLFIQKVFGVIICLMAILIHFNIDRDFQTAFLDRFPGYGSALTRFENNDYVKMKIDELKKEKGVSFKKDSSVGYDAPNKDFVGGTRWLNSEPLSLNTSLKGKVVLVDFWTYTCINCIRTLPYLVKWYDTYKDDGFVIVGVHSPEFEFEKKESNVREAMKKYGITYPVVQDNEFAIWRSYNNRYWPAHYLIDREGRVRMEHFGEGAYEETEKMIQDLLDVQKPIPQLEGDADQQQRTPETYVGYERLERLRAGQSIVKHVSHRYTSSSYLGTDEWAFEGMWTVGPEYATSQKKSSIHMKFRGKDVFLVMRPEESAGSVRVQVLIDGVVSKEIDVRDDDMYQLVKGDVYGEHELEVVFDGKVHVYAFTFG